MSNWIYINTYRMAQITCAHWPLRMIKDTTILSSVTLQCWPIFRLHHMHADHRYGVLLQMSHVVWSVCLSVCVGHVDELCRNDWIDWDAVWGLTHVGPEKLYWSGGARSLCRKGHFRAGHVPAHGNTHICVKCAWPMHAAGACLCCCEGWQDDFIAAVRTSVVDCVVQPLCCVFAAVGKMVMQPTSKILWPLVKICHKAITNDHTAS